MRVTFLACVSLVVLVCFVQDSYEFTCQETSQGQLTDITKKYRCTITSNFVECNLFITEETWGYGFTSRLILNFSILNESPDNTSRCLGMADLKVTNERGMNEMDHELEEYSSYVVEFNPTLSVGVLRAATNSSYIAVSSEILQMNIISRPWYWNFYSSRFEVDKGWLRSVSFEGIIKYDSVILLQNTSIQILNITSHADTYQSLFSINYMPLLKELHLRGYGPDADSFAGMPELEIITIRESEKVIGIPKYISRLPQLRHLEVVSCGPYGGTFINPTEGMPSNIYLETLNLNGNSIDSLSGKFPILPSLRKLSLRACRISFLDENVFENVPQLQELDLSENVLENIKENTFVNFKTLNTLDLSENSLSDWPILFDLSLDSLNLSKNNLTYFINLGSRGTTVDLLNVSSNRITDWIDKDMFSITQSPSSSRLIKRTKPTTGKTMSQHYNIGHSDRTGTTWVKNLDVSKNFIATFSEVMLQSIKGLEEIDLGDNHFDCVDCRLIPFRKWLNTTSTNVKNLGTSEPLLCASPADLRGRSLVQVEFIEDLCLPVVQSLWVLVLTPLGTISIIVAVACGIVYRFRSPLVYMLHLYHIRKRGKTGSVEKGKKYAFDAFICYSSHDRRFVITRLAPMLEKGPEQYVLCLHERDFPLGSRIVENIVDSIQQSHKTIIVLSEYFIDSKWCRWELEMANHKLFHDDEHFLILIELEELDRSKLGRNLQYLMETRTYLKWPSHGSKDEKHMYQRLKKALGPSMAQRNEERDTLLRYVEDDV